MASRAKITFLASVGCILFLLPFWLTSVKQVAAQTNSSDEKAKAFVLRLSDGGLDVLEVFNSPLNDRDEICLLIHEVVHEELDLTPEQRAELKDYTKKYQEQRDRIAEQVAKQTKPDESTDAILMLHKQMTEITDEWRARVSDMLLSHQQRRLIQIRNRYEIRRDGINQFLTSSNIVQDLQITEAQKHLFRKLSGELSDSISQNVNELRQTYLDAVLDSMSSENKKIFEDCYLPFLQSRMTPLFVCDCQHSRAEKLAHHMRDAGILGKPMVGFAIPNFYVLNGIGQLVPISENPRARQKSLDLGKNKEIRFANFFLIIAIVDQLCNTSSFTDALELDSSQVMQLQVLNDAIRKKRIEMIQKREERIVEGLTSNDEIMELDYRDVNIVAESSWTTLERILRPDQKERLEVFSECLELFFGGFHFAIEFGQVGKRLRVTDKEKESLRLASEKFFQQLRDETKESEQEILRQFRELLEPDQRNQISELLGAPLEDSGNHLELLLLNLRAASQR